MKTRFTAIILSVAMILGVTALSGCADTSYAMTINGESVAAGEYIYAQLEAAGEAAEMFREENPDTDVFANNFDYFKQEVDGTPFGEWVNTRALEICKERVAYAELFDELELVLPTETESDIKNYADGMWASTDGVELTGTNARTMGAFFEGAGVSKASFTAVLTYNEKAAMVFPAYYGKDGIEPVSDDELKAELARQFARFRMIEMPLEALTEMGATTDELDELAESYVERLSAGEAFSTVHADFFEYVESFAPAPDEPEQTEEAEDYSQPDLDYIDEVGELGEPDEVDETDVADEVDEDTDEVDEDTGEVDENSNDIEDTGEADENDNDFDKAEPYDTPEYLSEGAHDFLFAMGINDVELYKDEDAYYVLQRLDINEREDWFEDLYDYLLRELKSDDMENVISERAALLSVTVNEDAINRYKPEKIAKKGLLQEQQAI